MSAEIIFNFNLKGAQHEPLEESQKTAFGSLIEGLKIRKIRNDLYILLLIAF